MAVARASVFQFTNRWPLFRSLFAEKPDLDSYIAQLEQRDQQLEAFLTELAAPAWITYTPAVTNFSGIVNAYYQKINRYTIALHVEVGGATTVGIGSIGIGLPTGLTSRALATLASRNLAGVTLSLCSGATVNVWASAAGANWGAGAACDCSFSGVLYVYG
jgi:hypothetical protein